MKHSVYQGYKWQQIECNKSQLQAMVNALNSWNNISPVAKMNKYAYELALAEAKRLKFGLDDTIEFEIAVKI